MAELVERNSGRTPPELLSDLINWFKPFTSCIVAFSAGVDSSLLAYCARKALSNSAYAVTSLSPSFSEVEKRATREVAAELGIQLIEVQQHDLGTPEYVSNGVTRCYFCRRNLADAIQPVRERLAIKVCIDGTHKDDMGSPRPGIKALREAGFRAPYVELDIGKEQIRSVARLLKLSNSERPSEACLSSRVAFGQKIDLETLRKIETAENAVRFITNANVVRVRTIGERASVEVNKPAVPTAIQRSSEIERVLKKLGYLSVVIDPDGYRSGKMLELFVRNGL
ncbi:MAG: ATP-dependent sacrificial sulfur transferase LarE [Nitrososphaerota archaeon]|nr:ATP-dependent sacrificial sulfur transferase LarE [Nitrososphaerota archaeon]